MRTEIHQFLENILKIPLPKYGENFKISGIFREKINYELPSENLAEYERSKWGVTLTFSNLHLDDLLFIFVSILLEKKIVFFSKDIALLTATM